jgi:RimJ/RimL family protein N-acetyltransferase
MGVSLSPVLPSDVADVQAVIESDPAYAERVTGLPPGPADAQSLLMMRPPDVPEEHKVVLGIRRETELVGLVDLVRGYPEAEVAYVGLLLVRGDLQGQGIGRSAHEALLAWVRDWPEVRRVRLAVVATNRAVEAWWESLGYRPVGPPVPYSYNTLVTTARRFERQV